MIKELLLTTIVKQEDKGYSILCPELNVASQGETFEEAVSNIKEATELYIESAQQLGIMDEVLDQLGITKQEFNKGRIFPNVITASVPIRLAA